MVHSRIKQAALISIVPAPAAELNSWGELLRYTPTHRPLDTWLAVSLFRRIDEVLEQYGTTDVQIPWMPMPATLAVVSFCHPITSRVRPTCVSPENASKDTSH